jgi:uncharacterized lipoprotein YmbA
MHARRLLIAAALSALLAACASAPTKFHTLDPVAPAGPPVQRPLGTPVRVDSVMVPPELDRAQIVRRAGPGKLDLADDDRWAGALDELARGALASDLALRLPAGATVRPDDPALPRPLHKIDVVIERFEGATTGPVTLIAHWTLLGDGPDQALARHEERIEVPSGGDIDGTVTAMSAALGILADRIVVGLR